MSDFDPALVEKAARAIYDLNPDVQPWDGDPYHFAEANGYRKRLALKQARAVLASVAEPVRAEGAAESANAFIRWAAKNETAEPPLDWAWFGEIARRYSPLHEEYNNE